jgi:hypothetical protein
MAALIVGLGALMLTLGTTSTTIAWQIRGKLDSIDNRLDVLEDLAGIERAR